MLEVYRGGIWRRGVRSSFGKLFPFELGSVGTIEETKIEVKIFQIAREQEKEEPAKILNDLFF